MTESEAGQGSFSFRNCNRAILGSPSRHPRIAFKEHEGRYFFDKQWHVRCDYSISSDAEQSLPNLDLYLPRNPKTSTLDKEKLILFNAKNESKDLDIFLTSTNFILPRNNINLVIFKYNYIYIILNTIIFI